MTSGVKVSDNVKDLFDNMKVSKKNHDPDLRPRIVIMRIRDGYIVADEEDILREREAKDDKDIFKTFLKYLKGDKSCYVLYDCHFEKKGIYKEEIVSIMWNPSDAKLVDKMVYASSKDSLKGVLGGVKHHLEVNDYGDICTRKGFADKLGYEEEMTKLEGHDMNE